MSVPDYGSRLRAARALRNMTQVQLAERVGVSQGAIAQWEEHGNFRMPVIPKLAQVLGVSEAYLSGHDEIMGAVEEFVLTPRPVPQPKRLPTRAAQAHAERKRKRGAK